MRVVITQRIDAYVERQEQRDALDQAWADLLVDWLGKDVICLPIPNRPQSVGSFVGDIKPDLIVLSGGNDLGEFVARDETEKRLLTHACKYQTPVLGVCRGMQVMNSFCGGGLSRTDGHGGCEHLVQVAKGCVNRLPSELRVNSYHNWAIQRQDLAVDLQAIYEHADGGVEALMHKQLPWLGVMWHPERTALGDPLSNAVVAEWLRKATA